MPDEANGPPWAPWARLARADLEMAQILAGAASPSWGVCYHVQQAVEKGLKALLVAAGNDPPKSHNLVRLNAASDPPVFGVDDEDMLAALTLWSVEQRYPADHPEPDDDDVAQALAFGQRAMANIEARLTGGTSDGDTNYQAGG